MITDWLSGAGGLYLFGILLLLGIAGVFLWGVVDAQVTRGVRSWASGSRRRRD